MKTHVSLFSKAILFFSTMIKKVKVLRRYASLKGASYALDRIIRE